MGRSSKERTACGRQAGCRCRRWARTNLGSNSQRKPAGKRESEVRAGSPRPGSRQGSSFHAAIGAAPLPSSPSPSVPPCWPLHPAHPRPSLLSSLPPAALRPSSSPGTGPRPGAAPGPAGAPAPSGPCRGGT